MGGVADCTAKMVPSLQEAGNTNWLLLDGMEWNGINSRQRGEIKDLAKLFEFLENVFIGERL